MSLPVEALRDVVGILSVTTGLAFPDWRLPAVEAEVARCMSRCGERSADRFAERLRTDGALLSELVGAVAVGETWFFREPEQQAALRARIIPDLLGRRHAGHVLRAWSAGCSTGEEVWTLAIELVALGLEGRSHVVGTDVSARAIEKARQRTYRPWSLRRTDPPRVARWVHRVGDRFVVDERLASLVRFAAHNLAAPELPIGTPAAVDLVVCRNVLIYLEDWARRRVMERLCAALADGGWLILGATDPIPAADLHVEPVPGVAGIYRRRTKTVQDVRWRPRRAAPSEDLVPRAANASVAGLEPNGTKALARRLGRGAGERELEQALARQPESAELRALHGLLLLDRGRLAAARDALLRATLLDAELAVAHFALGTVLLQLGDPARASRSFAAAAAIAARHPGRAAVPLGDGERWAELLDAARRQAALAVRRASVQP